MRGISILVAGLSLLATACGGGGGSAGGATTGPTATATTPVAIATTAAADPAATALAAKAVMVKADLPPDWTEHTKGKGVLSTVGKNSRLGCSVPTSQPGAYPWATAYDGGIYQKAKLIRFATSSALVFKDVDAAKAYAATLRSAAYVTCWTKSKAKSIATAKGAAPGSTFRADPVKTGSGALEATLRFQYQALVGGKLIDANGAEDLLVYRHNRTVILLAREAVASEDQPKDIAATAQRDLESATTRLLERVRT